MNGAADSLGDELRAAIWRAVERERGDRSVIGPSMTQADFAVMESFVIEGADTRIVPVSLLEQASELIEAFQDYRVVSGGGGVAPFRVQEAALNRLIAAIDANPPADLVAALRSAAGGG